MVDRENPKQWIYFSYGETPNMKLTETEMFLGSKAL